MVQYILGVRTLFVYKYKNKNCIFKKNLYKLMIKAINLNIEVNIISNDNKDK